MSRYEHSVLTRRQLLACAMLCLGHAIPAACLQGAESAVRRGWSGHFVRNLHDARSVGERYLQLRPEERSTATLARELFGTRSLDEVARERPDSLKETILAGRASDFRNGDLVVLDGWVLARTEARFLALVALSATA